MKTILKWLLITIIICAFPLVAVWALNNLFGLSITYTFKTWLAVWILNIAFGPNGSTPASWRDK